MCDYSLANVKSRPAAVGDKLKTKGFGTGTNGFAPADAAIDDNTCVCVLPGTELAFDKPVEIGIYQPKPTEYTLARFRQINKDQSHMHHDALEFPDGHQELLTYLALGQNVTVLQLPATPKNEAEVEEQTRVAWVG
jgi:hypothetical protein